MPIRNLAIAAKVEKAKGGHDVSCVDAQSRCNAVALVAGRACDRQTCSGRRRGGAHVVGLIATEHF